MENKFEKYFKKKDGEWHNYKIGVYHVSAIGCTHQNLEPEEHYGPCLRSTYYDYVETVEKNEGAFKIGNILHEHVQDVYKKNEPASIVEFPIKLKTDIAEIEIEIRGSVDLIDMADEPYIIDLKTSSMYTFPSGKYDLNPTYETQVILYTFILRDRIFKKEFFNPDKVIITYIKKHNLETIELDSDYDDEKGAEYYKDFLERISYLHECLITEELPVAEPHKWCKYCTHLSECLERGDLVETKQGRKKRIIRKKR
jgi:hypothetical protein